jgi:2-hydroxycyclohexanecarboxyl-CoA dehydrogenase
VVTGAGSGIGRASALALAGQGCVVVAADLDGAAAEDTASSGRAAGHDVRALELDVTSDTSVAGLAAYVDESLGSPTVLVHCAGWDESMPFLETEPAFWEKVVAVNYLGVVRVTHALLPAMIAAGAGGRIVSVASDAGRVGSSGETVYAGAKGGVIAFTKSIAREVAKHRITANAVCPGPTDTPLFARQGEALKEALVRAIPMRRLARPEEIASAISFFAAEESGFVTGQVLSVSGGLTMHG